MFVKEVRELLYEAAVWESAGIRYRLRFTVTGFIQTIAVISLKLLRNELRCCCKQANLPAVLMTKQMEGPVSDAKDQFIFNPY